MKIWVDDVRPAPDGYMWCKSVNDAIECLCDAMKNAVQIEVLDLDHDAGDYYIDGGDYIKILDYMEEHMVCYFPIHIHSMNAVGIANMRCIINRNGWREVF